MSCQSPSVQAVMQKTAKAKSQIDELENLVKKQDKAHKKFFSDTINSHLSEAKINDSREIYYGFDIKTEYTSEFSLDKIASVVTSVIKAAGKAMDPNVKQPATSPDAIAAYVDVVNAVAEAAKSSSTAAGSLSFSMNRMSPGLYGFLYASSMSIKSDDTFGSEAVTSTIIYYKFIESIDDIKNEAKYGAALIDYKNLMNMKTIQAALTDDLAAGKIDIDTWTKKDASFEKAIKTIEDRLKNAGWYTVSLYMTSGNAIATMPIDIDEKSISARNKEIALSAVQLLSQKGSLYEPVIHVTTRRIENGYF
ncbi:hypothetical protein [uncultured Desulfovibrio sp.]|uniref:hypothetical protein n=1 Tax=uncultured Desulfovibrio sp. TaxID=167968 RepID=UPI00260DFF64|nr:hypothetical protein [uncultured Desulfovibrio sp.]